MSRLLKTYGSLKCHKCAEQKNNDELFACVGCSSDANCTMPAYYCGESCQRQDWKKHKQVCASKVGPFPAVDSWVDHYRLGADYSVHRGNLELVTWEHKDFGWGGAYKCEVDDLKKKFEEEFDGDLELLLNHWDNAFRWTCCGLDAAEGVNGCDHHGDMNNEPCKCDFCRGGRPIPDKLYNKKTQHKKGLTLRKGPDPRSCSPAGLRNWRMRQVFGFTDDAANGSDSDSD